MLRVGLTGELGSGKSTVARMLAERGAIVLSSDEMARKMMEPGHAVYARIVEHFGNSILRSDGSIDRPALARIAFDPKNPRVEELNAIIHPAVIDEQARVITEIARTQPHAIVVVESALIFSTKYGSGWRDRFDCIVVVTAPDEVKIQRFVTRTTSGQARIGLADLHAEAQQRLTAQRIPIPAEVDYILIENNGALDDLEAKVDALWKQLFQWRANAQNSYS